MHAFDRQTDGRTDRILIARPRLHCIQRGKKKFRLRRCGQIRDRLRSRFIPHPITLLHVIEAHGPVHCLWCYQPESTSPSFVCGWHSTLEARLSYWDFASHRDITTLCPGDPRSVCVKVLAAESCQNWTDRLIICQIFASYRRALHFNAGLAGGDPLRISP